MSQFCVKKKKLIRFHYFTIYLWNEYTKNELNCIYSTFTPHK